MKRILYSLFCAMVLAMAVTACSDNYNKELVPVKTELYLDFSPESIKDYPNRKISLDAGSREIKMGVTSNTRWIAEVDAKSGSGGWCLLNNSQGLGDGSFDITIRDNMTADRTCEIELFMMEMKEGQWTKIIPSKASITISQVASQVRISPSSLEPFPADNPKSTEFTISADNIGWTLSVSYEGTATPEFISVTPNEGADMTSNGDNSFTGYGNGKFSISLQPNHNAARRTGFLTLSSEVGRYSVEIIQEKADYTFVVSPTETQTVIAEGGTLKFSVYSPVSDWKITTSDDWVILSTDKGEKSDNRTDITVTVLPNTTNGVRRAQLLFTPAQSNVPQTVEIVQQPFDLTFMASPEETLGVVTEEGQSKSFGLDSRFNWELNLPSWITADSPSGKPSTSEQIITLNIAKNNTGNTRHFKVTVVPLPTEFAKEVIIDPKSIGIAALEFTITQFGGTTPAISVPWLAGEYSQTSAIVEFNFYSPFYPIYEAGLEWKKADEETWNVKEMTFDGVITEKVSVELTGLDPATEYVARGYVVYGDNKVKQYGETTIPFTTAGKRPIEEDNSTPDL